jgi:hypothetical protein
MKKSFALVAGMFALAATIIVSTSSCSKDPEATPINTVPGVTLIPVRSNSSVLLTNQNGTGDQFFQLSTVVSAVSSSTGFDLAYGNGSAAGNEFFIGGANDVSVQAVYGTSGTNQTTFKTTSTTAAVFDTLTNSVALANIVNSATNVNNGVGTNPSRIRSATAWAIGDVFAFTTGGTTAYQGVAKVVAVPSGTSSTSGNITLSIKWY